MYIQCPIILKETKNKKKLSCKWKFSANFQNQQPNDENLIFVTILNVTAKKKKKSKQ